VAGPPAGEGQTTHITVVDQERNLVALTATLGDHFGSAVVIPGTGIVMNNATMWFDPRPGAANSLGPGKRIVWAGTPTLVLRHGRPFMALGAPGGRRIISAVVQVIVNVLDCGMGMQAAVAAPRIHCEGREVEADALIGEEGIGGLRRLGHEVTVREESFSTSYFARPNGVLVDPATGELRGGVNQYKPALAVGL
jgi:gamma-glutamyltranspeptidase/glutathione hydrolase